MLDLGLEEPLLQTAATASSFSRNAAVHLGQLGGDRVALPLAALDEPEALLEAVELVQEAAHLSSPSDLSEAVVARQ